MIKFTMQIAESQITATIYAEEASTPARVSYEETYEDGGYSRLKQLKRYIRDRGGLTGSINPDLCTAMDLHHALTTAYSIPGYAQLDAPISLSTENFAPTPLPPRRPGIIY